MALSEALKEIYSSNVTGVRAYDTVELSHSLFTQTFYMVADSVSHDWKLENDVLTTFEPFGFNITQPVKGSEQQEMRFVFDNILQIGIDELELASGNMNENIVLTYRPYIDGSDVQQSPAIILNLSNVTASLGTITANASRVSLYGRKVPNRSYDSWIFKGLK